MRAYRTQILRQCTRVMVIGSVALVRSHSVEMIPAALHMLVNNWPRFAPAFDAAGAITLGQFESRLTLESHMHKKIADVVNSLWVKAAVAAGLLMLPGMTTHAEEGQFSCMNQYKECVKKRTCTGAGFTTWNCDVECYNSLNKTVGYAHCFGDDPLEEGD